MRSPFDYRGRLVDDTAQQIAADKLIGEYLAYAHEIGCRFAVHDEIEVTAEQQALLDKWWRERT